jgi:hypothetical protein
MMAIQGRSVDIRESWESYLQRKMGIVRDEASQSLMTLSPRKVKFQGGTPAAKATTPAGPFSLLERPMDGSSDTPTDPRDFSWRLSFVRELLLQVHISHFCATFDRIKHVREEGHTHPMA